MQIMGKLITPIRVQDLVKEMFNLINKLELVLEEVNQMYK